MSASAASVTSLVGSIGKDDRGRLLPLLRLQFSGETLNRCVNVNFDVLIQKVNHLLQFDHLGVLRFDSLVLIRPQLQELFSHGVRFQKLHLEVIHGVFVRLCR